jgi:ABC-2 type transport system permease protein
MSGRGPHELGSARALRLIAQLSLARSLNRLGNVLRRRPREGERSATGRKATGGKLLLGFMALFFAWQTATTTALLVQRVSRMSERRAHPGIIVVDHVTYALLELAAGESKGPRGVLSEQARALLDRAAERTVEQAERAESGRAEAVHEAFEKRGLSGFVESAVPEHRLWPSAALWYGVAPPYQLLPLAVVAFFLALAQVLQHVAGSDDDLARVGPGLEWLFSFPVRARALFLARAVAAPFASPLVWVVLFPFYAVVFACAGQGVFGLLGAALAAVYVALFGGGLRVLLETTLRRALPSVWVSRVQAVLLTLSLLPLAAGYTVAHSPISSGVLEWAARLPGVVLYQPLTLPLVWASGGTEAWSAMAFALGALAGWLALCVGVAERMVRDGITTGGGEHVVVRGSAAGTIGLRPGLLRGVMFKEWRALFRDRRTRAQALLAPLLLLAMQFFLNPTLANTITSNARHAAAAAFAVSAFSLTTSALPALAAEGPALYWLYTAPVPLARALLQKLCVRAAVSACFGLLVFGIAWVETPALIVPSLPYAVLAFVGIGLYSVIAVGIGTLGTDVLEPEPRRRVRPGGMYLFMLLAALFAHAIYTPSWWDRAVQGALSALLAFAVWQKLLERLPFLLDPTEAPPPVISVADGAMATLAFFVLQSLFSLPFSHGGEAPALTLLVAFVGAGSTVALVALWIFHKNRVPHLMLALGLRRRPGPPAVLASLGIGIGVGVLAAGAALGYLWVARHVPLLDESFDEAQRSLDQMHGDARIWMLVVAVLAAPLFEEFIFRGILYRGFRHSVGPRAAALSSALVFALVHPAPTAVPVFIMALLAAGAYERTGWLATPIAAHMTYNSLVFGSALLR